MDDSSEPASLLVVTRFRVAPADADGFAGRAREAIAVLAESAGFLDASLGQSTDDPQLRVIAMRWSGVGAWRRALSRFEVKVSVVPLLSTAIDEPSAFEIVHARDRNGSIDAGSGLAADAGEIGLGHAAAASVPSVRT